VILTNTDTLYKTITFHSKIRNLRDTTVTFSSTIQMYFLLFNNSLCG